MLNACIAAMVLRSQQQRQQEHVSAAQLELSESSLRYQHSNPGGTSASARILLGCALLYTLTQFPTAISNFLELLAAKPFCWYDYKISHQRMVMPITNTILLCNYTFNFVVYCIASRRFRQEVVHAFRKRGSSASALLEAHPRFYSAKMSH